MTPPLYSTVYLPGKGHVVEVEEGCSVGEHRGGGLSDPCTLSTWKGPCCGGGGGLFCWGTWGIGVLSDPSLLYTIYTWTGPCCVGGGGLFCWGTQG